MVSNNLFVMAPNFKVQKVQRKVNRCLAIIEKENNIKSSEIATNVLAILNAGLSTGLTEEAVLNATAAHGEIVELIMLPNKSYCFLKCQNVTEAQSIYDAMHNKAHIGQGAAVVYLNFFENSPASNADMWKKSRPAGLILLEDFVSTEEEKILLQAVAAPKTNTDSEELEKQLKHRLVRHFGYEFVYGSNNIDPEHPLARGIPSECEILWPRAKKAFETHGLAYDWQAPDQLTVNEYEPGQGIPPHVDTHSAFLDPILVLSLEGDTVMEFRRADERIPVLLPRRSFMVMSGESRYDWTHGITQRLTDVIPTKNGALTTRPRGKRTSLTFRKLRRAPCDCSYPTLCDTKLQATTDDIPTRLDEMAAHLEENNVHKVYDQISTHFSETRHTPWPQVAEFLNSFTDSALVLDVGCGNGKYLHCNPDILMMGCDRSQGLLTLAAGNGASVFRCDCLQLPVCDGVVDGAISIAVIHHLATPERRLAAIREMARVLQVGGRALIYVWAKDQKTGTKKSSYLLQNKAVNKHKTTEELQRQETVKNQTQQDLIGPVSLPIHTNRTEFQQQDVYVPWKLKSNSNNNEEPPATFLRYYHVFEEGELEMLIAQVENVKIVRSYYDQGNHCVIFEKEK